MSSDLENPAAFIGHVAFDDKEMKDFNPISEIEKLEAELKKQLGDEGKMATIRTPTTKIRTN